MSESSRFQGRAERQADELWNVSLFPVAPVGNRDLTLGALENVDERRSRATFLRPLTVILESSGGILG